MEKVEEDNYEKKDETMSNSQESDLSSNKTDIETPDNQILTASDSLNLNNVPTPTSSESVTIEQSEPAIQLNDKHNASSTEVITNSN